ncbi:hypothetical protein, partial [Lysinibacillus sphaericus]
MKNFKFMKFLSSILVFVMVLSLLVPLSSASAEESKPFKQDSQSESIIQLKVDIAEQLSLSKDSPTLHESLKNVSKAGVVKGKGQGNRTITGTYGEHTLTFDVFVKQGNGNGNGNGNG